MVWKKTKSTTAGSQGQSQGQTTGKKIGNGGQGQPSRLAKGPDMVDSGPRDQTKGQAPDIEPKEAQDVDAPEIGEVFGHSEGIESQPDPGIPQPDPDEMPEQPEVALATFVGYQSFPSVEGDVPIVCPALVQSVNDDGTVNLHVHNLKGVAPVMNVQYGLDPGQWTELESLCSYRDEIKAQKEADEAERQQQEEEDKAKLTATGSRR